MSKKRTKQIEKYYFDAFVKASGLESIEREEDELGYEKPDFRFLYNKQKIGVEITQFYIKDGQDSSSEQRQKEIRERVVKKAQGLYKNNHPLDIEVSFGFNLIEKENGLAQKISDLLGQLDFPLSGSISPDIFAHIPELSFMFVNLGESYEDIQWQDKQCYSTSCLSIERLQKIISGKEELSKKYDKCDKLWLLVVIDFFNRGMDQELQNNLDFSSIEFENFDEVYVYKTIYDQIIKLSKNSEGNVSWSIF